MSSFLFFTDVHASTRRPSSRRDNYIQTVLDKLDQVNKIGEKYNVDFYICGGDLFHTPDPALSGITFVTKCLKKFKKPIYTAVGSHDHFNYQWDTLYRTALGVLDAAGIVKIVKDVFTFDEVSFYFTHHSNMIDRDVNNYKINMVRGSHKHIHIVHGSIYEKPIPGDYFLPDEYSNNGVNLVLCGHIHNPFEIKNLATIQFVNPGSLLRVKRNEDHPPKVVIVDTNTLSFKYHEIQCSPHEEVFDFNVDELASSDVDFGMVFKELEGRSIKNVIDIKQLVTESCKDEKVLKESLNILEEVSNE